MTKTTTQEAALKKELEKLISFNPVTSDKKSTKALLVYVATELKKLNINLKMGEKNSYPWLVAGTRSLMKSKILLQAHIDVVPAPQKLFKPKLKNNWLFGRGAYDMLFATASYLVLLRDLHSAGKLSGFDIGVMLTSDEEVGGHSGVGALIRSYSCEVCILPDAGAEQQLSISAKGVLVLKIVASGTSGHAARPQEYDNPILKITKAAEEISRQFPNRLSTVTTCSITKIRAGEALNQIPDQASLFLDIRYVPQDDPDKIQNRLENIMTRYDAHVTRLICEPCYSTDPNNSHITSFIRHYENQTGKQLELIRSPGSSDARFLTVKNIPVVMIRPDGKGLHAPTEAVSLSSLKQFTDVISSFVEQTNNSPSGGSGGSEAQKNG